MHEAARQIAAVVVVPPPLTGMTAVSLAMTEKLDETGSGESEKISRPHALSSRWPFLWPAYKHLGLIAASMRTNRESSLYVCAESNHGLIATAIVSAITAIRNQPLLVHHHTSDYLRRDRLWMKVARRLNWEKTKHIFLSATMRDQFVERYGDVQSVVIGNAVFVDHEFRKSEVALARVRQNAGDTTQLSLGFLGRVSEEKGAGILLELLDDLPEGIRLKVAGPPADECGQKLLNAVRAKFGPASAVGPVHGQQKWDFLQSIDLLLMPSKYANEAQPLVIWEAAACGVPTIATAIGSIADQVEQLRAGSAVDASNYGDEVLRVLADARTMHDWSDALADAFPAAVADSALAVESLVL